jgi:galactokinase
MMGGGFGGCTINLVAKTKVDAFISLLRKAYMAKFSHEMGAYVVAIRNGTSVLNPAELAVNTIL